jgi:catechol 2,3-dioxygenase-like lactoylglutathione lyase family enzyme
MHAGDVGDMTSDAGLRLGLTTLLVRDYDEARDWFVTKLGFDVAADEMTSPEKRWLVVSPHAQTKGAGLLLARASNEEQKALIGRQHGGRVGFFLYADDFDATFALMKGTGVEFLENVRAGAYGRVVVFRDLYGNKWDLLEQ